MRSAIVEKTREAIRDIDTQGIEEPVVIEASVGRNARAIGAAALPIIDRYLLSQPKLRLSFGAPYEGGAMAGPSGTGRRGRRQ